MVIKVVSHFEGKPIDGRRVGSTLMRVYVCLRCFFLMAITYENNNAMIFSRV